MDIDTGDSPPVCQKPYSLPLKHVEWVQKELEILERAGVIQRSMSPWASPIVIVPKKTEPGEPPRRRMCVDYRMLNSLLPPVNKAHSKAKGIVTLVPLPKIDEIFQLRQLLYQEDPMDLSTNLTDVHLDYLKHQLISRG